MENDTITRALMALESEVDDSNLKLEEKDALKRLIDKLLFFYKDHYNEIMKYDSHTIQKKMTILTGLMTDYIVSINDTIVGKNDAYCIINMIFKEINYDDGKGQFKKRRHI